MCIKRSNKFPKIARKGAKFRIQNVDENNSQSVSASSALVSDDQEEEKGNNGDSGIADKFPTTAQEQVDANDNVTEIHGSGIHLSTLDEIGVLESPPLSDFVGDIAATVIKTCSSGRIVDTVSHVVTTTTPPVAETSTAGEGLVNILTCADGMQQLFGMGFFDRAVNEALLTKYNNDVSLCTGELLSAVNSSHWYQTRH